MRGSPLLRAAIVIAALLLLLIPIRRLTVARSEAEPAAAPVVVAKKPVRLAITATAAPFRFEVSHLGRVIWRGESAASRADAEVPLVVPAEGVDLALKAEWAAGQTAAVRLAVSVDGDAPVERTVWGDGSVDEVLTFE